MFGLTSKQRNATKMVCYSELTSSLTSAEIKPILLLEVFRTRINAEYGLGSFVKWSPWKEMQFIAPISK